MIDVIAKIMLLVFFGFAGFLLIREMIRESKRSKIQFEKHQEFETQIVHHLGSISEYLKNISYDTNQLSVILTKIYETSR